MFDKIFFSGKREINQNRLSVGKGSGLANALTENLSRSFESVKTPDSFLTF